MFLVPGWTIYILWIDFRIVYHIVVVQYDPPIEYEVNKQVVKG